MATLGSLCSLGAGSPLPPGPKVVVVGVLRACSWRAQWAVGVSRPPARRHNPLHARCTTRRSLRACPQHRAIFVLLCGWGGLYFFLVLSSLEDDRAVVVMCFLCEISALCMMLALKMALLCACTSILHWPLPPHKVRPQQLSRASPFLCPKVVERVAALSPPFSTTHSSPFPRFPSAIAWHACLFCDASHFFFVQDTRLSRVCVGHACHRHTRFVPFLSSNSKTTCF